VNVIGEIVPDDQTGQALSPVLEQVHGIIHAGRRPAVATRRIAASGSDIPLLIMLAEQMQV
jgi:hypothetical protein